MPGKNTKKEQLVVDGLSITLTRKQVKNINLRVYPSRHDVQMSAPWHVSTDAVRSFAHKKLPWIREKLGHATAPPHPSHPDFVTGEQHVYQGIEHTLRVSERRAKPSVTLIAETDTLHMQVRPGAGRSKRAAVLEEWYRRQLKKQIPRLIEHWEQPMGVDVNEFGVKKMKTRWGSCNTRDRRIWLNLELAKKPPACLQYVVVHEMVHLLERPHNKRFYRLMSQFLPDWKQTEATLQGTID